MLRTLARVFGFGLSPVEDLSRRPNYYYHWQRDPYGERVRIYKERIGGPKVGSFGLVLSETEHGITHHDGWTEMTPMFNGVRGYHYLVRMDGERESRSLSRDSFEPAAAFIRRR